MKPKLLLIAVLASAITAGFWLGLHHVPARPQAGPLALVSGPHPVAQAAPFPTRSVKMATIAGPSQPAAAARHTPCLSTPWDSIQTIINDRVPFLERLDALRRLPARLTAADCRALEQFLLRQSPADQEQLGQVLKNELMNRLCALEPPPAGLGNLLAALYRDQTQPLVLRDYAVQHLAAYLEQGQAGAGPGFDRERQKARRALWQALQESQDSIAGTALLGLKRLSQAGVEMDSERLQTAALRLAGNPGASELTRISACQVCAQLGLEDALPTIEASARSSSSVTLQISAVGALGLLGGTNELALLESLLPGSDQRLRLPVQAAMERIQQRGGRSAPAASQPQHDPLKPI